jgi:hypothetical protein
MSIRLSGQRRSFGFPIRTKLNASLCLKSISVISSSASGPISFVPLGLGELDQTFVWLERAAESRDWDPLAWKFDVLWVDVVKHPRYAALLKKFGLDK